MGKYFAMARAELLDAIQEKAEIIIWLLIEAIPVFVMGSLWISNGQSVRGMEVSQLVTYYMLVLVVSRLTAFYFDEYIQDEIKSGEFSRFLVRPLTFPLAFIFTNIGSKTFSIPLLLTPVIFMTSVVFHTHIILPDPMSLLLFSVSILIAFGIQFTLSTLISAGAFFWEQAEALLHARWILEVIAGGYALPLSFYPEWLKFLPNLLPFKYVYYVPVSIFMNTFSVQQSITNIIQGFFWLLVMLVISNAVWKIGVKRYSGVGG